MIVDMIDHPLHQAVLTSPEADEPRLVFADWCEENGDVRAEFIRLQVEATRAEDEMQRAILEHQVQVYLRKFGNQINAPIHRFLSTAGVRTGRRRRPVRYWTYERGFIHHLAVDVNVLLDHADTIRQIGPIEHLTLYRLMEHSDALSNWAGLSNIKSIKFNDPTLYGAAPRSVADQQNALATVLSSPYLERLERVQVANIWPATPVLAALRDNPSLSSLQTARFCGNHLYNVRRSMGRQVLSRRTTDEPNQAQLRQADGVSAHDVNQAINRSEPASKGRFLQLREWLGRLTN